MIGVATNGKGGSIVVTVGSGQSGAGGSVAIVAGQTSAKTGGKVRPLVNPSSNHFLPEHLNYCQFNRLLLQPDTARSPAAVICYSRQRMRAAQVRVVF